MRDHSFKIDKQLKEIDGIKEVVRRFDEDICLKASKTDLEILKKENMQHFITKNKWHAIQKDSELI